MGGSSSEWERGKRRWQVWTCSSGSLVVKGRRAPSRQLEGGTGPGLVFKGEKSWPWGAPRGMLTNFTCHRAPLPSPFIQQTSPHHPSPRLHPLCLLTHCDLHVTCSSYLVALTPPGGEPHWSRELRLLPLLSTPGLGLCLHIIDVQQTFVMNE